ncbi:MULTISPECIES: iron-containing alcohol dehydrogenase [unclassified Prochlorococcus]|uniref:iron-containing alcohol dehydrogenase n=1 Tax=unclassified Prochlorococcus TaxID=2627481 RepID=UPI0005337DFC|nr:MULTISPECIES: iron-containing alcohol dehydrogenase [unclassified Prochlorococcus]KGG15433.1 Glycerol dehydrogenase [Prochlorococcus sp. MIT 0602]KGG17712.1 Glycerol dehydrogenase [Prochlorococcus sp. MIT 0603]
MQDKNYLHNISPEKVIRGESAWSEAKNLIPSICKRPLLLGRSKSTSSIRESIASDLKSIGVDVYQEELAYDCCEIDIKRICQIILTMDCDGIIASGGGKVLDAGKLIAHNINIPCITIPLSAATCAGWTALANIYTNDGAFIRDQTLTSCPKLLIFDYKLIRKAPRRTLASGIADALAKWYESSISCAQSTDALVQQAVQMARVLRDQILIDGVKALQDPNSLSWVRVAEGCSLTAGLIGGIGGAKCRTAAAHAVHNGLTQLDFSEKPLHGELVGFGILVQLRIEELVSDNQLAFQARNQLNKLLDDLDLPTSLESLGLSNITQAQLDKVSTFSCRKNSDIHNLPFKVDKHTLIKALIDISTVEINSNQNRAKELAIKNLK